MNFFKIHSIIKNNLVLPSYLDKNKLINEKDTKNKSIFGVIHSMFKDSIWYKTYSKTVDLVIIWKNAIKYFFIFCLVWCLLYFSIYYLNTNFIFIHVWKMLENWWVGTTVFMYMLLNGFQYVLTTLLNFLIPNLGDLVEKSTNESIDIAKKQIKDVTKTNFKKIINITEFITFHVEENFNSFKSSFISWFFNFKARLMLTAGLYKYINTTSIFNLITYFTNKVESKLLDKEFTLFTVSKKTKTTLLDKNSNYTKNLHEILTSHDVAFINTDNQQLNDTYYNSNIYNLINSNFKNLELFKWLKNYSLIHSRSFVEASLLNLKIIPLGVNINKWSNFNNNSFFNFYFSDIKDRNTLTASTLVNKNTPLLNTNNFLTPNENLIQTFSTLNKNFNWFLYRNLLLNCFTTTDSNFKFLNNTIDVNKTTNLIIQKNNLTIHNNPYTKYTTNTTKSTLNTDTLIMLLNYVTNYKFLTINSNLIKTNTFSNTLHVEDNVKLVDKTYNTKLMKF